MNLKKFVRLLTLKVKQCMVFRFLRISNQLAIQLIKSEHQLAVLQF